MATAIQSSERVSQAAAHVDPILAVSTLHELLSALVRLHVEGAWRTLWPRDTREAGQPGDAWWTTEALLWGAEDVALTVSRGSAAGRRP